jgi:cell division protein FtsB
MRAITGRVRVGNGLVLRQAIIDRGWRRSRRSQLVLLGCLLASASFVDYAVHGTHGLKARARLISRSSALEREIAGFEAMRSRLERDVALLAPDPPDSDIVEEIAAGVLGMGYPQDLVLAPSASPRPQIP